MREQRLLERIAYLEQHPARRGASDPALITESIMQHLQRILNTKQGSAEIADDYGLPDLTTFKGSFSTQSLQELEGSIREVIQKYEPRLDMVKVTCEPKGEDILSLYFKVQAKLSRERGGLPVMFETVMSSDGKMSVRE